MKVEYEVLLKYVERYYGYTDESDETREIAESIYKNYDHKRVIYAITRDIDLYDLDRWEAVNRVNEKGLLKERLQDEGYLYEQKDLNRYLKEFKVFQKELVEPLYEDDFEIMELT